MLELEWYIERFLETCASTEYNGDGHYVFFFPEHLRKPVSYTISIQKGSILAPCFTQ